MKDINPYSASSPLVHPAPTGQPLASGKVFIMDKKWFDIPGYEGRYQITEFGEVRSLNYLKQKGVIRTLCPFYNGTKYLRIGLCSKYIFIHKLVMITFKPDNPENKRTINHIDGNIYNNHYSNLEYATHKENIRHAYDVLHRKGGRLGKFGPNPKLGKAVLQYTKEGIFIAEWASETLASSATGILSNNISSCCTGRYKSSGGYVWKFKK